jgi:hypothetical protein
MALKLYPTAVIKWRGSADQIALSTDPVINPSGRVIGTKNIILFFIRKNIIWNEKVQSGACYSNVFLQAPTAAQLLDMLEHRLPKLNLENYKGGGYDIDPAYSRRWISNWGVMSLRGMVSITQVGHSLSLNTKIIPYGQSKCDKCFRFINATTIHSTTCSHTLRCESTS